MTFEEISSGNKEADSRNPSEYHEMSPGVRNLDFSEFKHHFNGGDSLRSSPKTIAQLQPNPDVHDLIGTIQANNKVLTTRPAKERRSRASRAT